jgi:hypothetical protein
VDALRVRGKSASHAAFQSQSEAAGNPSHEGADLPRFLLIWIAVPLVLFTVSQSKLPGYVLPAVPPCGLLLADWLRRKSGEHFSLVCTVLHSTLGGLLLSLVLLAPYRVVGAHPPRAAMAIAVGAGVVVLAAMLATVLARGVGMLRFVTLVPVVLGLAFVLRVTAPLLDKALSARPVAEELTRLQTRESPLAAFAVRRELEYGLTFYRDQPIQRYERGQVPAGDHLVVARAGSQQEIEKQVAPRRVSRVGGFAPQRLEFFWISPPMSHQHGGATGPPTR